MVVDSSGNLDRMEASLVHQLEDNQVSKEMTQVEPVTEEELKKIYGAQTAEVMAHKIRCGETRDDPNLPGGKVYLMAKEKTQVGSPNFRQLLSGQAAAGPS